MSKQYEKYLEKRNKNIEAQKARQDEREKKKEKQFDKDLDSLMDDLMQGDSKDSDEIEEKLADLCMKNMFDEDFFNELDQRENEWIEEDKEFSKLSLDEIKSMTPDEIKKYNEKRNKKKKN